MELYDFKPARGNSETLAMEKKGGGGHFTIYLLLPSIIFVRLFTGVYLFKESSLEPNMIVHAFNP